MADWTDDIESMLVTIIKTNFPQQLKEKYKNIRFTAEEETNAKPVFPTVYIDLLPMVEQGSDVTNEDINAVLATIQVEVTAKSKKNAKEVESAIKSILKSKYFTFGALPDAEKDGDIFRVTMRASRLIGGGDIL